MPEIKQNFTKGKMNKDLDERLIPKGEYREAQNIHISESQGSDVGAIENILSNERLTVTPSGLPSSSSGEAYEVIGYCKDLANKRIVYFITNFASLSFTDDIRNIQRANRAGTDEFVPLYNESSAIILYDIETQEQKTLVQGSWLNLSKNHLITGVAIVEDILFWTDNFNQPRKINIQTALEEGPDYYDCEENISVAKYAPYKAIMISDDSASSASLPTIDTDVESDYMKERFIRFSYRYKYEDGEYSLIAPFTQAIFEPLNGGHITNNDSASDPDDEKNSTAGEPTVLTGKKEAYKKGIIDIMQNRINKVELRVPLPNKNENEVELIADINGIYQPVHQDGSYSNPYNIKEIDILLKESDGISFKLVKNIKVSEIDSTDILTYSHQSSSETNLVKRHVYRYTYKSSEPTQVLPESQVNRVYDQVPLMAKTLEVVGNRVVFGNYVENYPYPTDINNKKGINYTVFETTKGDVDQTGESESEPYLQGLKQWMSKTYKNHTVKQRRTYQVGIVFSDIFGRQSPVILSSNTEESNPDTITVLPETNNYGANTNAVWDSTLNSYGKSLGINFEDIDLTNDDRFVASPVYEQESLSGVIRSVTAAYNPHGWYSYRIVIKQQEQEYHNVYAPHTFDGWDNIKDKPNDSLTGGRSWLFLHGDNVNKVPRSLNDTDLNRDGTMGSNVRLYPKVIFDTNGESRQNDSYHETTEVISLGTAYEQNLYISGDNNRSGTGGFTVYKFVYGKDKNPLVAELQNMKAYTGSVSNDKAKVFYADGSLNNQDYVVLASDQLGTNYVPTNNQFDGYSLNFTGTSLHEEVLVINTDSQNNKIDISSEQTFVKGDKLVLSRYYEGLSVFETEPFVSKLDIYYETSTSGLVSDLIEELKVDPDNLPTGLTIKQDQYDFGTGQSPVPSTTGNVYGKVAYVYENIYTPSTPGDAGDFPYIADLDATKAVNSGSKDLEFDIYRATNASGDVLTNDFDIEEVSGTYKLKAVGTFVYHGKEEKDSISLKVKVRDNIQNPPTEAILSVKLVVKNSKPTISTPVSPVHSVSILANAGDNSDVLVSDNEITNGGLKATGGFNKFSDLKVTHTFSDPFNNANTGRNIDAFFKIVPDNPQSTGKFEVKTTSNWTEENAEWFFARTSSDRTMQITVEDSGGLKQLVSVRIDKEQLTVIPGKVWEYIYPTNTQAQAEFAITASADGKIAVGAVESEPGIDVWITQGTGSLPSRPNNVPADYITQYGPVDVHDDNKVYIKQDLSKLLSSKKYVIIESIGTKSSNTAGFGFVVESTVGISIINVDSNGEITIENSYTVDYKF